MNNNYSGDKLYVMQQYYEGEAKRLRRQLTKII
jgi:hypothetical protein